MSRKSKFDSFEMIYVILAFIVILVAGGTQIVTSLATLDTVSITPTRIFERMHSESGTSYMMDAKTSYGEYVEYKVVDNFVFFHFESGKLKNQLHDHIGEQIECETTGWRVPILSMYENIHKCDFR